MGIAQCSAAISDVLERFGIFISLRRFSSFLEVSRDLTGKHSVVREISYAIDTFPRNPRDSSTIFQAFGKRSRRSWMKEEASKLLTFTVFELLYPSRF